MGFRLAILRDLKTESGLNIAIEYDQGQFNQKLQARVKDYMLLKGNETLTHDEVVEVVKFAFAAICTELKNETLTIP